MMIKNKNFIAIPPGMTIKEQLNDRGMTQKEFAIRMGMTEKHISNLINGKTSLTPETAEKLEMIFNIPSSFWNNLEVRYIEKKIKIETENSIETDIKITKNIPYNEMVKYNWIKSAKTIYDKVFNLRKFFEIVELSLLEKNRILPIACRRLAITDKSDLALMIIAQQSKIIARTIETKPINIKHLRTILPDIRKMTKLKPIEFCKQVKEKLSDCGIALVVLPHLKSSFMQGVTFYDGQKIVIGITTRRMDFDILCFTLFHEIAHILYGHIGKVNGTNAKEEKVADKWASDYLINVDEYNRFCLSNNFSSTNVLKFANSIEINPGIVVGRLQKERLIKYNMLNNLKTKCNRVLQ